MDTVTDLDRDWLLARVSEFIDTEEEPVDPDESLIFYGLDSIAVMTIMGVLKDKGVQVSFEELARNPTLNAWVKLIEERRPG